jgi:hypothetical protein
MGALIIWGPLQFDLRSDSRLEKLVQLTKPLGTRTKHQHRFVWGTPLVLVCDKVTTSSLHLGAEKGFILPEW